MIHYRPLIAKDPAIIYKGKSIPDLLFIQRRLPGKAGVEALAAAQEAFLIAPHAVGPADIEKVGSGHVLLFAGHLCVQAP